MGAHGAPVSPTPSQRRGALPHPPDAPGRSDGVQLLIFTRESTYCLGVGLCLYIMIVNVILKVCGKFCSLLDATIYFFCDGNHWEQTWWGDFFVHSCIYGGNFPQIFMLLNLNTKYDFSVWVNYINNFCQCLPPFSCENTSWYIMGLTPSQIIALCHDGDHFKKIGAEMRYISRTSHRAQGLWFDSRRINVIFTLSPFSHRGLLMLSARKSVTHWSGSPELPPLYSLTELGWCSGYRSRLTTRGSLDRIHLGLRLQEKILWLCTVRLMGTLNVGLMYLESHPLACKRSCMIIRWRVGCARSYSPHNHSIQ